MKPIQKPNVNNINKNDIIKNHKELCKLLEIDLPKGGKDRKEQIKDLERYFDYTKSGQKYIINEIYESPIPKTTNYKTNYVIYGEHKYMENYFEDRYKYGIYKVVYKNHIYIGSTTKSFKSRLNGHILLVKGKSKSRIRPMFFSHNAKLYMLEDMTGCGEKEIRDREQFYIKKYSNDENWICENVRLNTHVGKTYYKNKYGMSKEEYLKNNTIKNRKQKTITYKIKECDTKLLEKILNENNIQFIRTKRKR